MQLKLILKPREVRQHHFSFIRNIFSKTGTWNKKITKTKLLECEEYWAEKVLNPRSYTLTQDEGAQKKYILSMFPYPSGSLHMGHMRVYTVSDVLSRYYRLCGFHVVQPIGWDAFGLPAENAAIDRGIPPRDWTISNIKTMRKQLKRLRISFDWDREITTCDSEYYKWTQLLFVKLYQQGLAYQAEAEVNWDPVDQTVLADEQIDSNGNSWRSGAKAERKFLRQWYLRTTDYSQVLLNGLDTLDPDHSTGFANMQKAWLGQPNGVRIRATLKPDNISLPVFTSTAELLFGSAFVQISSKHYLSSRNRNKQHDELLSDINVHLPLVNLNLPVIVREHSTFTEKHNIRIGIPSSCNEDRKLADKHSLLYEEVLDSDAGMIINSDWLNGTNRTDSCQLICKKLQSEKLGGNPVNSELNDWLISRQRYWGAPIPMIHCTSCGIVPVPEHQLPVVLPDLEKIDRGANPLTLQQGWLNTACPQCGKAAVRETDTMDTFVDSSWYFLRYSDPHNINEPFSKSKSDLLMPVDVYIGGAEHAILHMYYARFFTYALRDMKMTDCSEPFTLQLALGPVMSNSYQLESTGKYLPRHQVKIDGDAAVHKTTGETVKMNMEKMSKSKFNGVEPAEVIKKHGVDQSRLYMLCNVSPRGDKLWDAELANKLLFAHSPHVSIPKLIHTMWHTVHYVREQRSQPDFTPVTPHQQIEELLTEQRNNLIKDVSAALTTFDLDEAIASIAHTIQSIEGSPYEVKYGSVLYEKILSDLFVLLHPASPHITAELWEGLRSAPYVGDTGYNKELDIFSQNWPIVDEDFELELILRKRTEAVPEENQVEESQTLRTAGIRYKMQTIKSINLPSSHINKLTKRDAVRLLDLTFDDNFKLTINKNVNATLISL